MNLDKFAKICNDEQINKMEMKRKDTESKVIEQAENMDAEHNERQLESTANKAIDKREICKQMQKQENFTMMRLGWFNRKPDKLGYS